LTAQRQNVEQRLGQSARARRADLAFAFPLAAFFAILALAAFLPASRLWGIDHLRYYPQPLRFAALSLCALAFLPPVARRVYRCAARAAEVAASKPRGAAAIIAIFAVSVTVFLSLRSATQLLGDGQLQAKLVTRLAKSEDVDYRYFADFVAGSPVAPATDALNFTAARALWSLAGWEPIVAWRVTQACLGGLFVLLGLLFLRRSRLPAASRLLVALAAGTTGALQLFFGYIETYTPTMVAAAACVLVSFRALKGGSGMALPVALFALAAVFHLQALLLAPSILFGIVWSMPGRRSDRALAVLPASLVAATIVGAAALAFAPGFNRFFLPLFGKGREPGVLSLPHLTDVLNQLLLVVPLAPFIIGALVARAGGSSIVGRAERTFALLVLAPCALFLFCFRPELGMARDWDLFVLPAAGFAVFGVTAARRFAESPLAARCFDRYLAPALAMALAVVVPWVGINASETRSVRRYERIISMDTTNPGYGLEILAMHYGDRGDEKKKAETYDKAFAVSRNPRYLIAACSARLKYGEIDGPARVLSDYLEMNPGYHLAREVYIEALVRRGDMDGVIRVCREGIERAPERPYYHLYLGIGHFHGGDITEARAAFDECLRRDPPTVMVNAIKSMLANPPHPDATH
jgi:hypothetical protein